MCGRTCVVCDQPKNARANACRTNVLKLFLHAHAHMRPHIARVRVRTHLRDPPFSDMLIFEPKSEKIQQPQPH